MQGLSIADLAARLHGGEVGANPDVSSTGRGPSISVEHRLLADGLDDESREPWSTAVLTADQAWTIDPDLEIDVGNDVILGFWLAESGSCPFSPMTDLRYDTEFQVIYPEVQDPTADQDCTDDANAHLIIVAVPRSELPIGNLTLWVNGDEPRSEGATFVADGELTRPSDGALPGPVLDEDGDLAIGETKVVLGLTTHCGLERLYWLIDGRQWLIADEGGVPTEWNSEVRGEAIDLMVTLISEDELEVSTLGAVAPVSYEPAPDIEGCD